MSQLIMDKLESLEFECARLNDALNAAKKEVEIAVSHGKAEALKYTPEERERYGKWCAQNDEWVELKKERDWLKQQLVESNQMSAEFVNKIVKKDEQLAELRKVADEPGKL